MADVFLGKQITSPETSPKNTSSFSTTRMREEYIRLYQGLRDKADPVTWRTTICKIKMLLGVADPDWNKLPATKHQEAIELVKKLLRGTYLEAFMPDVLNALGIKSVEYVRGEIDALIYNGRHIPEELLWKVANEYQNLSKSVAVVNPVGHYNDGETRIVAPGKLTNSVQRLIILASTQEMYGGSIAVLANVIRTIRNANFAKEINAVDVVIPMFGGSRSDKDGQSPEIGFEVQQAIFDAKMLSATTADLLQSLREELPLSDVPKVRFFSIDIHGSSFPQRIFESDGLEFQSICPMSAFAEAVKQEMVDQKMENLPLMVVASDNGATVRAERFAEEMSKINDHSEILMVYFDKKRSQAGEIGKLAVARLAHWSVRGKEITKTDITDAKKVGEKFIRIIPDDMLDTGGTAEKDSELLDQIMPTSALKIFVATHPVLSRGSLAVDRTKADVVLVGNTLNPPHLKSHSKVRVINLARSIVKQLET